MKENVTHTHTHTHAGTHAGTHTHTHDCYSALVKNGILQFVTNLEDMVLNG